MKLRYRRDVLEGLYHELPRELRDEMAIPSYLHRNPLVPWLVARRMRLVLRQLDLDEPRTLLDYGCGVGMLLLQLPRKRVRYYGVDLDTRPAERMLEAHGRDDARLLAASEWARAVPDESLDYVLAIEVLEHVDRVADLAVVFRRKLKPDGWLIVSGPTENGLYRLCRRVAGFSGDYHRRDVNEIVRDIRSAGFAQESRRMLPLRGPLALFAICRFR